MEALQCSPLCSSSVLKIFQDTVKQVWGRPVAIRMTPCPDACEGQVSQLQTMKEFPHMGIDLCCNEKNLAVILESPHIEEFSKNKFGRIGPASGRTGCRIRSCLNKYCNGMFGDRMLALVNVVQYQCSRGVLKTGGDRYKKNKIFELMFRQDDVKECFARRVKMFDLTEDVFLVACGMGNPSSSIASDVCSYLKKDVGAHNVISLCYHPSRWPNPEGNSKVLRAMDRELSLLGKEFMKKGA